MTGDAKFIDPPKLPSGTQYRKAGTNEPWRTLPQILASEPVISKQTLEGEWEAREPDKSGGDTPGEREQKTWYEIQFRKAGTHDTWLMSIKTATLQTARAFIAKGNPCPISGVPKPTFEIEWRIRKIEAIVTTVE